MKTSANIKSRVVAVTLPRVKDEGKYCGTRSSGSSAVKRLLSKKGRDTNSPLLSEDDTQGV